MNRTRWSVVVKGSAVPLTLLLAVSALLPKSYPQSATPPGEGERPWKRTRLEWSPVRGLERVEEVRAPSVVLVAVDASRSMATRDEAENRSRWDYLCRELKALKPIVKELKDKHNIDVHFYRFGDEVRRLDPDWPGKPDGEATDTGQMLKALAQKYQGGTVVALLVLGDGLDNDPGSSFRGLARLWQQRDCPIYTFSVGKDRSRSRDVAVTDVEVDPDPIPVKGKMTVRVTIRATGFVDPRVRVRISVNDREVASREEQLRPDVPNRVSIPVNVPRLTGEVKVTARVQAPDRDGGLPGELTARNNELSTWTEVETVDNRLEIRLDRRRLEVGSVLSFRVRMRGKDSPPPQSQQIQVRVIDPRGKAVVVPIRLVDSGYQGLFRPAIPGEYRIEATDARKRVPGLASPARARFSVVSGSEEARAMAPEDLLELAVVTGGQFQPLKPNGLPRELSRLATRTTRILLTERRSTSGATGVPLPPASAAPVVVLLFDTSPSMAQPSGGMTRLERAQQRALTLLEELPAESRVAILDSAGAHSQSLNQPQLVRQKLFRKLRGPSSETLTGQLDRACSLLADLARTSDGVEPPQYLYIFSDRNRSFWNLTDTRPPLPFTGPSSLFIDVGDVARDTLKVAPVGVTIDALKVYPPVVRPGGRVRILATLRATGGTFSGELRCRLVRGGVVRTHPYKVEDGVPVTVEFGYRASRGMADNDLAEGFHQAEVRLSTPATTPFNNVAYATFVVRRSRVLTVSDGPDHALHWRAALEALGSSVRTLTPDDIETLAEEQLREYDVVCLHQLAKPSAALWSKVQSYVQGGGGLVVVPAGEGMQQVAYRNPVARELLPADFDEPFTSPKDERVSLKWAQGSQDHPISYYFLRIMREEKLDFTTGSNALVAYRFWKVKTRPEARIVAVHATKGGPPALLERTVGQGKVLQFTTLLGKSQEGPWSNYSASPFFLVLVDQACKYLGEKSYLTNFACGETPSFPVPTSAENSVYRLFGPGQPVEGARFEVRYSSAERKKGRFLLKVGQAVQPGNYILKDDLGREIAAVSLNPDRVPVEEIEALLGKDSVLSVANASANPRR
jgi:hypothetical protein